MSGCDVDMQIGNRVAQARRRHPAMTLKHAADFLEITIDEFSQIERGAVRSTGEQLVLLADLMHVEPSWFFAG